jgi:hypothetical protein
MSIPLSTGANHHRCTLVADRSIDVCLVVAEQYQQMYSFHRFQTYLCPGQSKLTESDRYHSNVDGSSTVDDKTPINNRSSSSRLVLSSELHCTQCFSRLYHCCIFVWPTTTWHLVFLDSRTSSDRLVLSKSLPFRCTDSLEDEPKLKRFFCSRLY